MNETEELRIVRMERDALKAAVEGLLDDIGKLEKGSVPFSYVRRAFAPWERQDRVLCTCALPGVAIDSNCEVDHKW